MNEEQVDKLVWKIHTKADAKRILLAVAAEAREEGIDEMRDVFFKEGYWTTTLWEEAREKIREDAERLKEKL